MHVPIELKLGTHKVKAHLCTNFDWNPMKIYGVMKDYPHKIRSKVCHAYRVNCLQEIWHVDGVTIGAVLFVV